MRHRLPTVGLCVLFGALPAGCTSDTGNPAGELDRLVAGWQRDGSPARAEVLAVSRGPEHCEWTDVVFLQTAGSPGDRIDPASVRQYVRDPDGALPPEFSVGLDLDAEMPADARPTGFVNDAGIELFVSRDGSTAYLVDDSGTTEAWPEADEPAACA